MTKYDIKKALEICKDINLNCNDCPYDAVGNCNDTLCADALKLIIEQEKEIERLKANINQSQNQILETAQKNQEYREQQVKQAKIDVLNELKTRHDYAIKNMGYPWDISQHIDELIKEIEKGGESGRYDRHFTPNDNKLEIIVVKDLQEVEK